MARANPHGDRDCVNPRDLRLPFREALTDQSIGPFQPAAAPLARADTTEEQQWSI